MIIYIGDIVLTTENLDSGFNAFMHYLQNYNRNQARYFGHESVAERYNDYKSQPMLRSSHCILDDLRNGTVRLFHFGRQEYLAVDHNGGIRLTPNTKDMASK